MVTTSDKETPKIAEKVRFWEEQDRINQELIPRVLKQHKLFAAHIEGHETASVQIAALEARMNEAIGAANRQSLLVSGASLAVALCSIIFALVS